MRRLTRLLFNNASTLVFTALVIFFLLLLRQDTFSPYVWALMNGETSWRMALEDQAVTNEVLTKTVFVLIALFIFSLSVFALVADQLALKDEERDPPLRAMDEDANRFIGILLGSSGIYLAAAPGGAVLYSSVFGAITILWGFQLLFMAEEEKDSYTVSGASRLFGGASEREWGGDPLFRAWARKVKDRFKREEEQARAWQQQRQREREEYKRQSRRAYSEGARSKKEQGPSAPWTIEDPWSVLGVEPGTPMKKITQKWRRLCKRYHPDVVPTGLKEETEEALKKINAAYRMIKEKQKKLKQAQEKEEQ